MAKKKDNVSLETLVSLRDQFGLGTSQGNSYQNMINERMGSKKRHKVLGVPSKGQMDIAKAGRSEIVAEMKMKSSPMANVGALVLKGNTDEEIKKALKGSKTVTPKVASKKTKHSGTMMGGL